MHIKLSKIEKSKDLVEYVDCLEAEKEIEEPKPWESLSGHIDLMFYKLKKDLMKKKKPRKKKVKRRETK